MTVARSDVESSVIGEGHAAALQLLERLDLGPIEAAQHLLLDAYREKRRIYSIGNGGSASTAAHFSADLGKYAVGDSAGFRSLDLVSNFAAHTAWTNDEGWDSTWPAMLSPWLEAGDVLVAFSVHGGSGWSGNLVRGIELARERGARTIGFSGVGGGRFAELCDVSVVVPTPKDPWTTPLTEGLHAVLSHLLIAGLRAAITRDSL